jgi:hypothetical protein
MFWPHDRSTIHGLSPAIGRTLEDPERAEKAPAGPTALPHADSIGMPERRLCRATEPSTGRRTLDVSHRATFREA